MSVHAAHWDLPAARPLTAADAAAAQRSAFTLPRQLHDHERTTLFGLPLIKGERDHVASEIVAMAKARECSTIQFINAHCVNVAAHDAAYREALGAADFLLPDGSGLAIAARMAGLELGENLNGTDLFPDLCRHAAAAGLSIYLLGGKPGIATAAAKTMLQRYPDLVIAGTRHGYWTDEEEPALIEEINDSGAALVFVGLGVPRQEKWIARVRPELRARIVLGVGGLFDYYSGAVARAPKLFRATGMEWGWRLMQEPKRLFRRYILGNPVFLAGALQHALELRDMAKAVSASIKRAFDRALAGLALVLLSPLFLAVALAIKLEDRGPVFF
ncbi:MAG TPA: WecB/TagA/CpsF family glycosyltransferase, partial [Novosphingobium sp.]|nr:WecB/TagA/CpsF family glycosyltransferase [Novosphingobium sp.]